MDLGIKFEWDSKKNLSNVKKHNITFEEAATSFLDEYAIVLPDDEHSIDEERFILIGKSSLHNLLIVCHCYRGSDEIIRIISARKATRKETMQYELQF